MFFVVTYDLRSGRDRSSLFKTLRSFGRCCQFMASGSVISTRRRPPNLAARLLRKLNYLQKATPLRLGNRLNQVESE